MTCVSVGVPEMRPFWRLSDRPAGSAGCTLQPLMEDSPKKTGTLSVISTSL